MFYEAVWEGLRHPALAVTFSTALYRATVLKVGVKKLAIKRSAVLKMLIAAWRLTVADEECRKSTIGREYCEEINAW